MEALRSEIPRMGRKTAYVLFSILVILTTLNAVAIYLFVYLFQTDPVSEEIKRIIMSNYSCLSPDEHKIVTKLVENSEPADELNRVFSGWDTNSPQFLSVCEFGTKVLQHYAIYAEKKYLDATIKIINAINTKVLMKVNLDGASTVWIFDNLSGDCARLLVAFQYLGDHRSDESTNAICYNFIVKLVPELNKIKPLDDIKLTQGITARLLSTYFNDYSQYKKDVASKEMEHFKEVIKRVKKTKTHSDIRFYDYYNDMFSVFNFWKE